MRRETRREDEECTARNTKGIWKEVATKWPTLCVQFISSDKSFSFKKNMHWIQYQNHTKEITFTLGRYRQRHPQTWQSNRSFFFFLVFRHSWHSACLHSFEMQFQLVRDRNFSNLPTRCDSTSIYVNADGYLNNHILHKIIVLPQ